MLCMKCFLVVFFLTFPLSVLAQSGNGFGGMTGNDLLPMCQAGIDRANGKTISTNMIPDAVRCLSYIQGFIDGFAVRDNVEEGMKPTLCFPDGATGGQMVRIVTKWLEDHPARLHEPAWGLIFLAMQESFICRYPGPAKDPPSEPKPH